jgi:hypothetical protein
MRDSIGVENTGICRPFVRSNKRHAHASLPRAIQALSN